MYVRVRDVTQLHGGLDWGVVEWVYGWCRVALPQLLCSQVMMVVVVMIRLVVVAEISRTTDLVISYDHLPN